MALSFLSKSPQNLIRSPLFDCIQFCGVLLFFAWLFQQNIERIGYDWDWSQIPGYLYWFDETGFHSGPLLQGLWITIRISAVSLVLAMLIGLVTAFFRLSGSPVARIIARIYLEINRNTPLLIQIFFIYFVLGPVLGLERFSSAVLALSLFEGAYASEIFRAGILSVNPGQKEAALSLGLNSFSCYRYVILPQAIRTSLPPLTSQAISLIKDSALVSTIAIYDLTMQAQAIVSETFLTFEIWFTVGAMYLVITVALSFMVTLLEHRNS